MEKKRGRRRANPTRRVPHSKPERDGDLAACRQQLTNTHVGLGCYVQIPWQKFFEAQEKFAAELGDLLDAGNPNPWEAAPKNYIGLKKIKTIIELDSQNVPAPQIAKKTGVNLATVYRQLQRKHGKRRPGRQPKARTPQQPEVPKAE